LEVVRVGATHPGGHAPLRWRGRGGKENYFR